MGSGRLGLGLVVIGKSEMVAIFSCFVRELNSIMDTALSHHPRPVAARLRGCVRHSKFRLTVINRYAKFLAFCGAGASTRASLLNRSLLLQHTDFSISIFP